MPDNWLFAYVDSLDNPQATVLVPKRMNTEKFIRVVGDSLRDFIRAVQEGLEAASRGDLRYVDEHLGTIVRLNEDYASRFGALRGIPEHNKYIMSLAIEHHLRQGNPVTDDVREYASKYDVPLE